MKVLLLNPPYLKGFIRISRCTWLPISGSLWYPIFLAYCTGWLQKHDHKAKLVDAIAENLTHQKTFDLAKAYKPDLLVIYTSLPSLENDIEIAQRIKKATRCLLVLVGPWCAMYPENILKDHSVVDALVRQEFDNPILAIADNTPFEKIKGLTWRKNGEIINNEGADFVTAKDLDNFPFVSQIYKENLPIRNYYQASLLHPFIDLFTARGCAWGKCTFCLWPQTIQKGGIYRQRSIDNVIEEFKYLKKYLPEVKEVFFQDDMLPLKRADELSEAILKNNLKITWSGYSKADLPLSSLKLMKRAGCRFLHVGFESANPQILKNIHKGVEVNQMEIFIRNTRLAGIKIHGDFIVGLPGETAQTIRKTIDWAKTQDLDAYQFAVPEAHPTTGLYKWLKDNKCLTPNNNPSYPHLSIDDLTSWKFRAIRELHLRPKFILKTILQLKNPYEFFRIARTVYYLLPNLFLSKHKTS